MAFELSPKIKKLECRLLQISFGIFKKIMMFLLFKIYLTLKAPFTTAADDFFYLSEKQ